MFSKYGKFTKNNSSKSDNFGAFFSPKKSFVQVRLDFFCHQVINVFQKQSLMILNLNF
jgi:hypothetical protein